MNKTDLKHYADFLENLTVILQKKYWNKKAEYFAAPKGILHIKKRTARKAEYYIYTCENGVKHEKKRISLFLSVRSAIISSLYGILLPKEKQSDQNQRLL